MPKDMETPKKRWLTPDDMAQYIGSTVKSVYTLKSTRKIPLQCIIKRGKSLLFDAIEVDKWLDSLRCEPLKY